MVLACGRIYATPNIKIVGGIPANAHSWPSIAYVRFNYKADNIYLSDLGIYVSVSLSEACGGTLVNNYSFK